jgi:prepilin-type processing-associated H-X9-DG protein
VKDEQAPKWGTNKFVNSPINLRWNKNTNGNGWFKQSQTENLFGGSALFAEVFRIGSEIGHQRQGFNVAYFDGGVAWYGDRNYEIYSMGASGWLTMGQFKTVFGKFDDNR